MTAMAKLVFNSLSTIQRNPLLPAQSSALTCFIRTKYGSKVFDRIKKRREIDTSTWDGERFARPPVHKETQRYPQLYTGDPPAKGVIYDKKPFRVEVEAGKTYLWCSCGMSRNQPYCDKTHFYEEGSSEKKFKPRLRPVKYVATENKTVYFCNCKQTNNRPFCDNSHKSQEVVESTSIFRN